MVMSVFSRIDILDDKGLTSTSKVRHPCTKEVSNLELGQNSNVHLRRTTVWTYNRRTAYNHLC